MTNSYPTGCNYSEGHGACGGASNGLYCQNHQDCRRGCDCATRYSEEG